MAPYEKHICTRAGQCFGSNQLTIPQAYLRHAVPIRDICEAEAATKLPPLEETPPHPDYDTADYFAQIDAIIYGCSNLPMTLSPATMTNLQSITPWLRRRLTRVSRVSVGCSIHKGRTKHFLGGQNSQTSPPEYASCCFRSSNAYFRPSIIETLAAKDSSYSYKRSLLTSMALNYF